MSEPHLTPAIREWYASLGRKGGKVRAERLSPKRRSEIARKAARSRYAAKRKRDRENNA